MQKKDIDWSKLGFGYTPTDYRFEAHWKDGKWDEGKISTLQNSTGHSGIRKRLRTVRYWNQ